MNVYFVGAATSLNNSDIPCVRYHQTSRWVYYVQGNTEDTNDHINFLLLITDKHKNCTIVHRVLIRIKNRTQLIYLCDSEIEQLVQN